MIATRLLLNLAATVLVEGTIFALLFRRRDYVYYSVLTNLLTNPALNLALIFIVGHAGAASYWAALIALELIAVFAEAWMLRLLCGFRPAGAIGVSFIVNAASLLAGYLCDAL
ncbi:MAG: hypothetical protein ABFC62_03100 [Clostridiaceae bacterium]|nr:hypothetical protein [Eubacteriales bacterium]